MKINVSHIREILDIGPDFQDDLQAFDGKSLEETDRYDRTFLRFFMWSINRRGFINTKNPLAIQRYLASICSAEQLKEINRLDDKDDNMPLLYDLVHSLPSDPNDSLTLCGPPDADNWMACFNFLIDGDPTELFKNGLLRTILECLETLGPSFIKRINSFVDEGCRNDAFTETQLLYLLHLMRNLDLSSSEKKNNIKVYASWLEKLEDALSFRIKVKGKNFLSGLLLQASLTAIMERHYNGLQADPYEQFRGFPLSSMWGLFVDVQTQEEKGWGTYERQEPGRIARMYETLIGYVFNNVHEPLTVDYLKEVHRRVWPFRLNSGQMFQRKPGCFRDSHAYIDVPVLSIAAHYEFYSEDNDTYGHLASLCWDNFMASFEISTNYNDPASIEAQVETIIGDYNTTLEMEDNPEVILKAIIVLCRRLKLLHPFTDANLRTIVTIIMNKELLRHGFSMAIFEEPSRIYCYRDDEFLAEVLGGMDYFVRLRDTGQISDKAQSTEALIEAPDALVYYYPIPAVAYTIDRLDPEGKPYDAPAFLKRETARLLRARTEEQPSTLGSAAYLPDFSRQASNSTGLPRAVGPRNDGGMRPNPHISLQPR